jgi:hypothetical protein
MAPITKPTPVFEFAKTPQLIGGKWNVIEPPAGLKDTGWLYQQKPPRNYENWCLNRLTAWAEWWTAQAEASGRPATLTVAAEDSSDADKQAADYVVGAAADAALVLTAAFAALPATGGTVLLAAGTYNCITPFSALQAGTWLRGQGPGTNIRWNLAVTPAVAIMTMSGTHRGGVENLRFSTIAGAGYVNAICAVNCRGITFRDVVIDRMYGAPSVLPGTPKGVGFFIHGCEAAISHCYARLLTVDPGPKSGAAVFSDTTSLTLIDDLIVDDETWIAPPGGSDYTPEPAILLGAGTHLISHVFARYTGGGIVIHSGHASVVSDCRFDDVDDVGIWIEGGLNTRVHGNSILAATGDGILVGVGADNAMIFGNEINTAVGNGIWLAGDAGSAVANLIKDCANGIVLSGAGNAARDNTVTGSTNAGIGVTGDDSQVTGNRLFGGDTGIELAGTQALCSGNILRAQADYMIHLLLACSNSLIQGNLGVIDGVVTPTCCLYHANASDRKNAIVGNSFYGVGTTDVWIQGDFHNVNGGAIAPGPGSLIPNWTLQYHDHAAADQTFEHTLIHLNLFAVASEAA